ncbi:MAG TPA: hypothetical protein VGS07_10550 [Thermoanaerobaculia bacterium]|jgi:hypothetical protein|nr:hypothetical protein [Thermoanaerobaculia bacterium]
MTPDCERADRYAAVRAAGRSWLHAGAIDEATLKTIEAAVPDDRVRLGPVFRLLFFIFTIIAVTSVLVFLVMVLQIENSGSGGLVALFTFVAGAGLAVATDIQIVRMRRSQGGIEAATSLLAISYLMGSLAWCILQYFHALEVHGLVVLCFVGAALAAAAAWRWGYWLYAGTAAVALLGALAGLPHGRLSWIVLPLVAAPFLLRLSESPRLPPSHRSSFTAVLAVALVGLYVAVHLGSWDWQWIEKIGGGARVMRPAHRDALWWLSVAATALVPLVLLGLGIRGRRYLLLILGAGTAVASLVTLRWYVHLAPLWIVLTASGALLVGLVLGLRRWLDAGPGKERGGFTVEPLFQDLARQRILEMGAAVVTLSPEARNLHEEPKFEGGGGQFGGGGSSADF